MTVNKTQQALMVEPFEQLRKKCATPAEAIIEACRLEASSPKAGNVCPGKPFADLTYKDFIRAGSIAAELLTDASVSFAQRILNCVRQNSDEFGTNVNLGILLLFGPLVAADQAGEIQSLESWPHCLEQILKLDAVDSRLIFGAIAESSAGGLGRVDEMDVRDSSGHDDIMAAMRAAKARDRIALQYATHFQDLIANVLPVVYDSIGSATDPLTGISRAHTKLLAAAPDSLIARKCGDEVARQVQKRAAEVSLDDPDSCRRFDQSLRDREHKLNPGTTADLIAGSLYLLLRTPQLMI